MKRIFLFICTLFITLQSNSFASEQPISLALQWYPQAQFAGYYMAQEKGIYAKYGLNVRLLHSSADSNSCDLLAQGKADYATAFLSTALKQSSNGDLLVNIGQFVQDSALMLIVRKDSGIKDINDMDGVRVGMWGDEFQIQPKALFKKENVDVTVVRQSPSFDLFMRGGLDVVSAMWYNEYHTLMAYGLDANEMTTFFLRDLEVNFPEDGLYTLESTYEASPEVAKALREASIEGWKYAFAHPEETLKVVLKKMKEGKVRANKAHQKWMLARMQDIISLENNKLNKEDFTDVQTHLLYSGLIGMTTSYEQFYRGEK